MSTVKSAEKVLKVLKALRGYSLQGISNRDLAEKLNESPSQITRALQTLVSEGLAKKDENDLYTLGTSVVQIAKQHLAEVERAKARIAEIEQRTSVNY
ncbi:MULTISPECIES: helix-turn-helix domain-containing protein [Acinetobacter]|uniref:Helix-turn-helix domain-containing protein n=1 Tax=Acinetobacter nematophilus TaxID=2994642 RepID=A0A9X3DQ80_9GAMM|nr:MULTISPECIES: helix-turn-helix domain-containing protein [Acinetobacter]MBJ8477195.1 helix-turn-helix domain-containing protein [Acinetobacter bereziniae]MCX5466515.1 helix-turn-helix domain-containing protein [Acinetobacter nematophilus]